jgi:hypothetical protein
MSVKPQKTSKVERILAEKDTATRKQRLEVFKPWFERPLYRRPAVSP